MNYDEGKRLYLSLYSGSLLQIASMAQNNVKKHRDYVEEDKENREKNESFDCCWQ